MNLLFTKGFPLEQLKILHSDLTQLEGFLQMDAKGYHFVSGKIDMIYEVQEIIEGLISREKQRIRNKKNESDSNFLDY